MLQFIKANITNLSRLPQNLHSRNDSVMLMPRSTEHTHVDFVLEHVPVHFRVNHVVHRDGTKFTLNEFKEKLNQAGGSLKNMLDAHRKNSLEIKAKALAEKNKLAFPIVNTEPAPESPKVFVENMSEVESTEVESTEVESTEVESNTTELLPVVEKSV